MPRALLYDEPLPLQVKSPNRAVIDPPPPPQPEPEPLPPLAPTLPVDAVYATSVLSQTRLLSSFYWARTRFFGQPLILLHFDVEPLVKDSWLQITEKLDEFSKARRARLGRPIGTFVETELLLERVFAAGGYPQLIPAWLSHKDSWHTLCQSAATFLSRGDVGYTLNAKQRIEQRPFLDTAGAYAGPRTDDPTVPAFLYGVVLGLDEAAARDPKSKPPKRAARN